MIYILFFINIYRYERNLIIRWGQNPISSIQDGSTNEQVLSILQTQGLESYLLPGALMLLVTILAGFGVYFLMLVKEKGFMGAIDDLERNYPMDPQQAKVLEAIRNKKELTS